MVCERLAASRPGVPASLIVDAYDEFTHNRSICKGDASPVPFESAIQHEPRHQTPVNDSNITNRIPDELFASFDFNFFENSSHTQLHLTFFPLEMPYNT